MANWPQIGWIRLISDDPNRTNGWYVPLTWMVLVDVYGRSILIHISVPLILWDWPILLFMKFRGLLDCHPEMRIRKQFGIKRVLQCNGIRVQLFFFFLVTRFCWNHQMFLEAGLCSMAMSLLRFKFRSSLFRFSLKLPNTICSLFRS